MQTNAYQVGYADGKNNNNRPNPYGSQADRLAYLRGYNDGQQARSRSQDAALNSES